MSNGNKQTGPSWQNRRRMVVAIVCFCFSVVGWVLYKDTDTMVARTAVESAFLLLGMVSGWYIGAVAWQDVKFKQSSDSKSLPPVMPKGDDDVK